MYNKEKLLQYIISELNKRGIKYEIHNFSSGASVIDIWHNNFFYVIQLKQSSVGLSLVTNDSSDFTTTPDETFFEAEKFIAKFDQIII
jgi:hypothetical protein